MIPFVSVLDSGQRVEGAWPPAASATPRRLAKMTLTKRRFRHHQSDDSHKHNLRSFCDFFTF